MIPSRTLSDEDASIALRAAPVRIAHPDIPIPFTPVMEHFVLPSGAKPCTPLAIKYSTISSSRSKSSSSASVIGVTKAAMTPFQRCFIINQLPVAEFISRTKSSPTTIPNPKHRRTYIVSCSLPCTHSLSLCADSVFVGYGKSTCKPPRRSSENTRRHSHATQANNLDHSSL